jgi:hypothetical protein
MNLHTCAGSVGIREKDRVCKHFVRIEADSSLRIVGSNPVTTADGYEF